MKGNFTMNNDFFNGLFVIGIVAFIFAFIAYYFLGILVGFIFFVAIIYYLSKNEFDMVPKDHIATIVSYNNQPRGIRPSGYFWKKFGLLKIHKIYDITIDRSEQTIVNALTKDGKEVTCTFQIFTRIFNPLALEKGLGYDNFEDELSGYRENQYEEYVRSVPLSRLETSTHDDLKQQAEKIVKHHRDNGIEVVTKILENGDIVPEIEVFNIQPKLAKVREDVQKEKYRQDVEEVRRKRIFERISRIYLQLLCPLGDETEHELLTKARAILGENAEEEIVLMKAIKLAEAYIPDKAERKRLYAEAKYTQELHEGKRTVSDINYSGINGANMLLQSPGK